MIQPSFKREVGCLSSASVLSSLGGKPKGPYFLLPGSAEKRHTARIKTLPITLYLLQLAATLFMTGVIWFVQIVHYPLFAVVFADTTPAAFRTYESAHANRTGWVVFPPMAVELLVALAALWPGLRPPFMTRGIALILAGTVGILWLSTGLIQVPLHNRLLTSADQKTIYRLILSNWLRTIFWTLRASLLTLPLLNAL